MNDKIRAIQRIAETEFSSIVTFTFLIDYKLRIILIDESFVDVNVSLKINNKFGFHWETKNDSNEIYRFDNFPDIKWKHIESFPFHFHSKEQENVIEPPFSKDLYKGFREFMNFIKEQILSV